MDLRKPLKYRIKEYEKKYRQSLSASERKRENKLIQIKSIIQKRGYLTTKELWKVAYWKMERGSKLTLENKNKDTNKVTEKAFSVTDDWDKLQVLCKLKGIGPSKASAILHLYDKEKFPIIDKHALWSMGRDRKFVCNEELWVNYVRSCRKLATQNNVNMREFDRALWRFSYEMEKQNKT